MRQLRSDGDETAALAKQDAFRTTISVELGESFMQESLSLT